MHADILVKVDTKDPENGKIVLEIKTDSGNQKIHANIKEAVNLVKSIIKAMEIIKSLSDAHSALQSHKAKYGE